MLDRQQERSQRRREHLAELNRRMTEADAQLKRLYQAIGKGLIDLDDPALREQIDGLKAVRDQAEADAARLAAALETSGQAIMPAMLGKFARTARKRLRLDGGGYRRDYLRALAQRVEVDEGQARIMGRKAICSAPWLQPPA